MSETRLDTKTIGGWIITILLALFTGTLASNARSSEIEKDGREYKVRIEILEKNQDKMLKLVEDINNNVTEIKTTVKNQKEKP